MPDSDVDIVVEGLTGRDMATPYPYWEAWRMVEEIIEERPVDLIELETAEEFLREAIRRYRIML